MKKSLFSLLIILLLLVSATLSFAGKNEGFQQGIILELDEGSYTLGGFPLGDGTNEVPGHYWIVAGKNQLVGKHYNSSSPIPGTSKFWSSDAPEGELLYTVHGIIDTWSLEKAEMYKARGYVHYHELVAVVGGDPHPDKVLWLKHTARTSFELDNGPAGAFAHPVTPGIDFEFGPNGFKEYIPVPE